MQVRVKVVFWVRLPVPSPGEVLFKALEPVQVAEAGEAEAVQAVAKVEVQVRVAPVL